jgi:CheY-like chemotaxis protein
MRRWTIGTVERKLRSLRRIVEQANGCQWSVAGREKQAGGESDVETAPAGDGDVEQSRPIATPVGTTTLPPSTSPASEPSAPARSAVPPSAPPLSATSGRGAQESPRRQQSFLDWLGHELRNPIAVIELAVHSLRQLGDDRLEEQLSVLERQAGQLGRVVLELLEMARAIAQSPGVGPPARYLPREDDPVRLPMRQRLPVGQVTAPRPAVLAMGTRPVRQRLLLVEDNPDLSELLREMLTDWGFEVVTASTATMALSRASVRPPDVALIDIGLPDRDGCEVARALRRSLPATVRLIAMSGYGQRHDGARALSSGFDEYMVKPLNMTTLRRLLVDIPGFPVASAASDD